MRQQEEVVPWLKPRQHPSCLRALSTEVGVPAAVPVPAVITGLGGSWVRYGGCCTFGIGGSVVEFLPATLEDGVRFPPNTTAAAFLSRCPCGGTMVMSRSPIPAVGRGSSGGRPGEADPQHRCGEPEESRAPQGTTGQLPQGHADALRGTL